MHQLKARVIKSRSTLILFPERDYPPLYFYRLFEIAPDLQDLFPFEGEELSEENELLKKHALQVMESVGMAIGLMGDPEQLKEILIGLGVVHNMKSVQVDSFKVG